MSLTHSKENRTFENVWELLLVTTKTKDKQIKTNWPLPPNATLQHWSQHGSLGITALWELKLGVTLLFPLCGVGPA